jgi:Tfp pilus assembly protein PilO
MSESTKTAVAIVAVIAIAGVFWLLLLSPKREQASELGERVDSLGAEVTAEQQRATEALAAKHTFPQDYQRLIVMGKAVPAEAATPSLLVQLHGVGRKSKTYFMSISNKESAEGGVAPETSEATESAVSLVPLGASVGPAGLSAMPYQLEYAGKFFGIANFLHDLDKLVQTKDGVVDAHGRLITIDSFTVKPFENEGVDPTTLEALFNVTTYVTPPGQGLTAGATAAGPETAPASTTTDLP